MNTKTIDTNLLDETSAKAKTSDRLRMNYNIHESTDDPINRLLNAMEPGTYVRPHRHSHPEKTEACLVLRGSLDILIFDEQGNVIHRENLNPEEGRFGIDIPAGIWHGLIVNAPDTVVYEIKTGPYTPVAEVDLAPWAPDASDTEGVRTFVSKLLKQ